MENYIRFCVGFIAVFILFSCFSYTELKEMKKFARTVSIVTPDLNSIHDGDYTGEFQSGVVRAGVMVTVNNNRMDNITILEHQTGMGNKAELIIDDVLNAQSCSSHYGPFDLFASTGSREDLQRKGRFRYKPAINQSN